MSTVTVALRILIRKIDVADVSEGELLSKAVTHLVDTASDCLKMCAKVPLFGPYIEISLMERQHMVFLGNKLEPTVRRGG